MEVLFYFLFALLLAGNGLIYFKKAKKENKSKKLLIVFTIVGAILWFAIGELLMEIFAAVDRELFVELLNTLSDPVVIFISFVIGSIINISLSNKIINIKIKKTK